MPNDDMMPTHETSPSARRLSRSDWIEAAISVMVASSVERVRVEKLAIELGVSRGSFYWHFKDRKDLLDAVLEEWKTRSTYDVETRLTKAEPSPEKRLLLFMGLPLRSAAALHAADLELAILGWARRSQDASEAVRAIDESRCRQLTALFCELGRPLAEAELHAHQAYACLRYVAQRRDMDVATRQKLVTDIHRTLVGRLE